MIEIDKLIELYEKKRQPKYRVTEGRMRQIKITEDELRFADQHGITRDELHFFKVVYAREQKFIAVIMVLAICTLVLLGILILTQ